MINKLMKLVLSKSMNRHIYSDEARDAIRSSKKILLATFSRYGDGIISFRIIS